MENFCLLCRYIVRVLERESRLGMVHKPHPNNANDASDRGKLEDKENWVTLM
jgi:hypothetical protein